MKENFNTKETPDFSLVLGGPLFQFLLRSRLSAQAMELMSRRIIVISMFTWLPLLILTLIDGKALSGVELPFIYDIEMQVRFLLALPLLIAAELLVHKRLRLIVAQFIERNIITEKVLPKFNEVIDKAMNLRNSIAAELILFIFVYAAGYYVWTQISGIEKIGAGAETWYTAKTSDGTKLTLAGYWYIFVGRPVFQFLLLRWFFRLFIWARFLWQTSRLELNLIPTHPDRAAGLGFLGTSTAVFVPLLLAFGVMVAGLVANQIFFSGAKLLDFKMEIIGVLLISLLVVLGPLLVFSASIMKAKRTGLREYGIIASRYISEFDNKWVRGGAKADEEFIGSGDIQSLADLGNSFQVIREITPFPFGRDTVIQLIVITLLPIFPLVLTMIPLEELVMKLLGTIF
jgi:hypothetical protein